MKNIEYLILISLVFFSCITKRNVPQKLVKAKSKNEKAVVDFIANNYPIKTETVTEIITDTKGYDSAVNAAKLKAKEIDRYKDKVSQLNAVIADADNCEDSLQAYKELSENLAANIIDVSNNYNNLLNAPAKIEYKTITEIKENTAKIKQYEIEANGKISSMGKKYLAAENKASVAVQKQIEAEQEKTKAESNDGKLRKNYFLIGLVLGLIIGIFGESLLNRIPFLGTILKFINK